MENEFNLIDTGLVIDQPTSLHLRETAGWGKFLAIAGFAYSVLIVVGAISAIVILTGIYEKAGGINKEARLLTATMIGAVYFIFAAIIFFMSLFLFRFSKRIHEALLSNDQQTLGEAFRQLKICFRFTGVITAIVLVLSVLGVFAIIFSLAAQG